MTKLEIACVIIGLIGMIISSPIRIELKNGNLADIMAFIVLVFRTLAFLLMVLLPLYFRLWR